MHKIIDKISFHTIFDLIKCTINGQRLVLVSLEPEASFPPNSKFYSRALTHLQVYPGKVTSTRAPIRFPVDMSTPHHVNSHSRAGVCMVASNKFSPHPAANYELRRAIAVRSQELGVNITGQGWGLTKRIKMGIVLKHCITSVASMSKVSLFNCRQFIKQNPLPIFAIDNKFLHMENFKVAIVIENENSYVSEKLIESIQAGCVPVYVGPEVPEHWIPSKLYFKADPNLEDVLNKVEIALHEDIKQAHKIQIAWLESKSAALWHRDAVQAEVLKIIEENLENSF